MLSRKRSDRALPTFITLLVVGVLLMTFDVRLEGGGVVGTLRTGTQAVVAPLQSAASRVVNPIADMVDSLSNIVSLREENAVLSAELAEAQADLVAVQDSSHGSTFSSNCTISTFPRRASGGPLPTSSASQTRLTLR